MRVTEDYLLIDGRNRICASIELELDVPIEPFTPSDPMQYVLSENLHRRHLTDGQLSMIAVDVEAYYAAEAKERQKQSGRFAGKDEEGNPKLQVEVNSPQPENNTPKPAKARSPQARDKAARDVGVSGQSVQRAKFIKSSAPDIAEQVESGELSLNKAYTQAKRIVESKPAPVPEKQSDDFVLLPNHKGNVVQYPKPKGKVLPAQNLYELFC